MSEEERRRKRRELQSLTLEKEFLSFLDMCGVAEEEIPMARAFFFAGARSVQTMWTDAGNLLTVKEAQEFLEKIEREIKSFAEEWERDDGPAHM